MCVKYLNWFATLILQRFTQKFIVGFNQDEKKQLKKMYVTY